MPALLSDAYGTVFAQEMQQRTIMTKDSKKSTVAKLGTAVAPAAVAEATADSAAEIERPVRSVVHKRPTLREQGGGNYEVHITIDRQDCHLLCLFIGVFTLSVLFNSNKRSAATSS